jgi:hypothetical protein
VCFVVGLPALRTFAPLVASLPQLRSLLVIVQQDPTRNSTLDMLTQARMAASTARRFAAALAHAGQLEELALDGCWVPRRGEAPLAAALARLRSLRALLFRNFDWERVTLTAVTSALRDLPALALLALQHTGREPTPEGHQWLKAVEDLVAMPALQQLLLVGLGLTVPALPALAHHARRLSHLASLELKLECPARLCRCSVPGALQATIAALQQHIATVDTDILTQLQRSAGAHVIHFHVMFE